MATEIEMRIAHIDVTKCQLRTLEHGKAKVISAHKKCLADFNSHIKNVKRSLAEDLEKLEAMKEVDDGDG